MGKRGAYGKIEDHQNGSGEEDREDLDAATGRHSR